MVKHKRYPFYGTQYHPEKIQYEHKPHLNKIQNFQTVEIAHKTSMIIFDLTLQNQNYVDDETELEALLIQNYPLQKSSGQFEQIYVFPKVFNWNRGNRLV